MNVVPRAFWASTVWVWTVDYRFAFNNLNHQQPRC